MITLEIIPIFWIAITLLIVTIAIVVIQYLIFHLQASHYRLSSRQQWYLLRLIYRYHMPCASFFEHPWALAKTIKLLSGSPDQVNIRAFLLEKLYQIYHQITLAEELRIHSKIIPRWHKTHQLPIKLKVHITFSSSDTVPAVLVNTHGFLRFQLHSQPWDHHSSVKVSFYANTLCYHFSSKLLRLHQGYVDVKHTTHLTTSLRRRYQRIALCQPATFVLDSSLTAHYDPEDTEGYPCTVRDISEGGLSFTTTGQARIGLSLKVQLTIASQHVVICGIIRDFSYNQNDNTSLVHVQAHGHTPFTIREPVLAYVYRIRS